MKILYEEKGNFCIAETLQKNDKFYQILINNKKIKIKNSKVFFELENFESNFLALAESISKRVDLDLLWNCCEYNNEVSIDDLSRLYFNKNPNYIDICAILIVINNNPIYFNRINKTLFKPVSKELLEKLKLARDNKEKIQSKVTKYYELLINNIIPDEIKNNISGILYNPDKKSAEYKSFHLVAKKEKITLIQLAIKYNLIASYDEFLLNKFLLKYYNKSTEYTKLLVNNNLNVQEKKELKVFSIDNEKTIEIDDGFSVQKTDNDNTILGVHICLPTISYNHDIEKIILSNHRTLYLPDNKKVTMLPSNWIQEFSLNKNKYSFCISIYMEVNADFKINSHKTSLDKIFVSDNLRIENLEKNYSQIIENNLNSDVPYILELNWLYKFAKFLNRNRINNFNLFGDHFDVYFDFDENGKIKLKKRYRGNPIDLIVSEISILANSIWAELLYNNNFPCIYRVQNKDLSKVKLTTKSSPHYGISKNYYAWFTSPLRRSIDFYNQLSLLKFILNEKDFKFNSLFLNNLIDKFEIRNSLYNNFQKKMQLYWSIKYIIQNKLTKLEGILIKRDLYKILELPIIVKVDNVPSNVDFSRSISFKIKKIDLYNLLIKLEY